ncbi:MAG: hypothetical protein JWO66_411, partial [Candidatus Eremiobacteraeota bacterium]|nr:hypothetical protein [Candidatus Eremiobacteraeota bacterium]
MIRKLSTLIAAAAVAFIPLAASAQVSPGTELVGTMS